MYYPYFRGKQYELIAIRETAEVMAAAEFVPIVEPVSASLTPLRRTIQTVVDAEGSIVVIANPEFGPHARDGRQIGLLLQENFEDHQRVLVGILLNADITVRQAASLARRYARFNLAFIHAGFLDGDLLITEIGETIMDATHVFIEAASSAAYRRRFTEADRVLIRDGFQSMRNRDYPSIQLFSDLHHTYPTNGVQGFGDFLIVGNEYREQGGPAYAVAIHITFIDPRRNNDMYIYHFISDSNDTPTDPGGKFAEALQKLIARLARRDHNIFESSAIATFRDLHRNGHYPGLGTVKKLSMQHHIETLQHYFRG